MGPVLWISIQNISIMSIMNFVLIIFICILLYRYLKGSVAFYILFGLLVIWGILTMSTKLGLHFLPNIIGEITKYSMILIAIIFQPELRSILLSIGNNRVAKRIRKIKNRALNRELVEKNKRIITNILEALAYCSENYIGATIVVFESGDISSIINTGVVMESNVTGKLIESVFVKDSPLHDGALIIQEGRIRAASCILPVSEKLDLSASRIGLRHKSAVGVTEVSNCIAIIISETTGKISYAREGRLFMDKNLSAISQQLNLILNT